MGPAADGNDVAGAAGLRFLLNLFPPLQAAGRSSPAHSIRELIGYARSHPGKLTMASPGTGSAPFLAAMLFVQMADIKMTHVPYRGASPAFTDLGRM
jgi:tripartite-type tricarboxylate transporter receptor subunit TctC